MERTLTAVAMLCRISEHYPTAVRELVEALGVEARFIGTPEEPRQQHWRSALEENRGCLLEAGGQVDDALAGGSFPLLIAGDCAIALTTLSAVARHRPDARVLWLDTHGDFNTPETTPSGNVWGMPFAMIVGRGDADLLAAAAAPTVDEADAALLGGQVLDETESRMLAASRVAHFGAGMLGTDAGLAALAAWARVVASRVDAFYIAFDMDALDGDDGWALTMSEPGGLSLETALAAVGTIAASGPVAGFGATAILIGRGGDGPRTADAVARLAEAALGA